MTARAILTDIYQSKEVADCLSKLRPTHLRDDILQNTFLELFQKDEEQIMDLYNRGKLKVYIVKVLYNTAHYTGTKFAKQLSKEQPCDTSTYSVQKFLQDENEYEKEIEAEHDVACALSRMHWYKVEMLKTYAELGTHQAISDVTGIPRSSIAKTIKNARKEFKQLL